MKVVCVHFGTKYPVEYVNILNSMVKRHSDAELVCISDSFEGKDKDIEVYQGDPCFEGWWNKIQLFKPNFLKGEKFLYLDLDVVITKNINHLFDYEGFTIIDDWIYDTYNSSAMLMTGGEYSHVYDIFVKDKEKNMRIHPQGDQQMITNYIKADNIFSKTEFASFRMSGCEAEPKGDVVVFHGKPNPHEVKGTWVEKEWV